MQVSDNVKAYCRAVAARIIEGEDEDGYEDGLNEDDAWEQLSHDEKQQANALLDAVLEPWID